MAITRTIKIDVTVKIVCCRDGVESYIPLPQEFHKTLTATKDSFDESLTMWRDRIVQKYEDYLWNKAEVECDQVGTRRLCKFDADWTRTIVEETIPKVSKEVLESIKRFEKLAETPEATSVKVAIKEEIDRLKKIYNIE